jgi:3-oxoacyl-[acyl-carrier protein] reductase
MKKLNNKTAVITGSVRGLGKAIAERYAAMGANIVINYSKDKASADEVLSNILAMGVKAIAVQADVSSVKDLERLFAEAKAAFGKIDIVVANAGIEMVEVPVTDFSEEQFDKVFSINTKGTYFTMQQAPNISKIMAELSISLQVLLPSRFREWLFTEEVKLRQDIWLISYRKRLVTEG